MVTVEVGLLNKEEEVKEMNMIHYLVVVVKTTPGRRD